MRLSLIQNLEKHQLTNGTVKKISVENESFSGELDIIRQSQQIPKEREHKEADSVTIIMICLNIIGEL